MLKRATILAATAAILAVALPCAAVDPEQVYQAAMADMKAGKYADACPKFAEARKLAPESTPALHGLATCYDKAGKWASAWTRYRELAVEMKAHGDSRAPAALGRADELAKILSTVTVKVASPDTPGLIIRLDREELPRVMYGVHVNVDPGEHLVEATAPGFEVWQAHLTVGDKNDAREIQIPALSAKSTTQATPAPAGPPPWLTNQQIVGTALGAVGVVGLAVGGVLGGLALSKANGLKGNGCNDALTACTQAGLTLFQQAQPFAHGSTASLVIGGAALVAGVTIFATGGPKPLQKTGARVILGPVAGPDMKGLLLQGGW